MREDLLTPEVLASLIKAGWYPGRKATELVSRWESEFFLKNGFMLTPSARSVLLELGGLSFEQDATGETVARRSFWFDPTRAQGESDRFADFESAVGGRLCPVGEADGGDTYLVVARDGRVLCLMDDGWIIGNTIEEALVSLLLGRLGVRVDAS